MVGVSDGRGLGDFGHLAGGFSRRDVQVIQVSTGDIVTEVSWPEGLQPCAYMRILCRHLNTAAFEFLSFQPSRNCQWQFACMLVLGYKQH